jgi:hypothetical protein
LIQHDISRTGAPRGALVILALLPFVVAQNATAASMAITPQIIEAVIDGSASLNDAISYTNVGTEPVTVTMQVADFDIGTDGRVRELPPGTNPASAVPYLKVSPVRIEVAPNQRVFFRYSLTAPESFTHLRAMVFFSAYPAGPRQRRSAAVMVPRLGIPMYVESRRSDAASLELASATVENDAAGAPVLRVSLENRSDRLFRPGGSVQVRSSSGTKSLPFNESSNPVLPGHTRHFEIPLAAAGGGELSIRLRLTTSHRTVLNRELRVPAEPSSSDSRQP